MDADTKSMWAQLTRPFEDKAAYKEVRMRGGFTSICAYFVIERMTEVFGLCGDGWGTTVDRWEAHGDNVACIGSLYWTDALGERHDVPAVGDAVVMQGNVAEAYKKAQTNLISKAASFLGVGLSVYKGKGIDDPYADRERCAAAPLGDDRNKELRAAFHALGADTYGDQWDAKRGELVAAFAAKPGHAPITSSNELTVNEAHYLIDGMTEKAKAKK